MSNETMNLQLRQFIMKNPKHDSIVKQPENPNNVASRHLSILTRGRDGNPIAYHRLIDEGTGTVR